MTIIDGHHRFEKYKSKNFAQRYPISERQFERMVSFYVNNKGLTYPKGGEASQVIAKRGIIKNKLLNSHLFSCQQNANPQKNRTGAAIKDITRKL